MTAAALVIACIVVGLAAWFARNGVPLPRPFKHRACQGAGWRRAFPGAPKSEIRSFLSVFVDAFAFHRRQRLKFGPNDGILAIYRARYPHPWQPDGLELEALALSIEKKYGLALAEVWRESLTLGELFAGVRVGGRHPATMSNVIMRRSPA